MKRPRLRLCSPSFRRPRELLEEHSLDPSSWRGGCPSRLPAAAASARLFWGVWPANPAETTSNFEEETSDFQQKKVCNKAVITSGSFSSSSSSGLNASAQTVCETEHRLHRCNSDFLFPKPSTSAMTFSRSQTRFRSFWFNNSCRNNRLALSFLRFNQTLLSQQSLKPFVSVIPAEMWRLTSLQLIYSVWAFTSVRDGGTQSSRAAIQSGFLSSRFHRASGTEFQAGRSENPVGFGPWGPGFRRPRLRRRALPLFLPRFTQWS